MKIKIQFWLGFCVAVLLNASFIFSMESEFEAGESSGAGQVNAGQLNNDDHFNVSMGHFGEGEDCFVGSSNHLVHYDDEDICLINKTEKIIFITVGDLVDEPKLLTIPADDIFSLAADEPTFVVTPGHDEWSPENNSFTIRGQLHPGLTYEVRLHGQLMTFTEKLPENVQADHPLHVVHIPIQIEQ